MQDECLEMTDFIRTRLKKELYYYGVLRKLSARQKGAVEENDTQLLLRILTRKQKYVSKIERLQKEITECRQQWETIKEKVHESLRIELRELTSDIAKILEEMVGLEKETMDLATARRAGVMKKMHDLKLGKNALRHYLRSDSTQKSHYMDKTL